MLFGARALQGAFAALLAPSAMSLLTVLFTEARERARAFGIFAAIAGVDGGVGLARRRLVFGGGGNGGVWGPGPHPDRPDQALEVGMVTAGLRRPAARPPTAPSGTGATRTPVTRDSGDQVTPALPRAERRGERAACSPRGAAGRTREGDQPGFRPCDRHRAW
ncbi:hypothetical protein GCM10010345_79540 [Streptomyces canarius]|uniref:Major facilitator superfamily (MFS) profile domain-containing protein n=2 Tax=Streptomyces TaxID=1883 RepID=A0ABQ3DE49_9ACTN|nr:hypothetical protein GCM10010345_79540 [Streptomyces canarius]